MCRLATNPDSYNEPLGISGQSFALKSEVEQGAFLDRSIRFHPPRSLWRKPGPDLGVFVTEVILDGERKPCHALCGGKVDLLPDPQFSLGGQDSLAAKKGIPVATSGVGVEAPPAVSRSYLQSHSVPKLEGRNNLIVEQPGLECIDPFNMHISSLDGTVQLRRKAMWDPDDASVTIFDVSEQTVRARGGQGRHPDLRKIIYINGIDPTRSLFPHSAAKKYITKRIDDLCQAITQKNSCDSETNTVELEKRLSVFRRQKQWQISRVSNLAESMGFQFALNEPSFLFCDDSADPLPNFVQEEYTQWHIKFWLCCWDPDALCLYIQGSLSLLPM